MNETLRRILMRNPLIPLASILFGSIWFTLSILAYVIGIFLPSTRDPISSFPPPRRSNGASARPAAPKSVLTPLPSILASKKDSPQHHVRFPSTVPQPSHRPRPTKRWSSPAGLEPMLPRIVSLDELQDAVVEMQSRSDANPTSFTTAIINQPPSQLSHLESASQTSSSPPRSMTDEEPESLSRTSSMTNSLTRGQSLTRKLPSMNVFRSRSKRRKSEGRHSRSGSISSSIASTPGCSPPMVVLELQHEAAKGSTSTFSSAEAPARSGIIQAFKLRPKRASASATLASLSAKPDSSTSESLGSFHQTPSPPPSPEREVADVTPLAPRSRSQTRRKPFTSYLNLSVQAPSEKSGRTPRTASLESGFLSARTPLSAVLTPSTPRCPRKQPKTPSGPVPRTQPYGYPYFAMMPNGEYATATASALPPPESSRRRRFGASSVPHSRSTSIDGIAEAEKDHIERVDAPPTPSVNTLGLDEMGQLKTPRATRRVATVS